ncbi:MAG: NAD(P)-dependent oxidoreductase [Rhodospirillales bacterium]|nr:MAG: NAD(P)-dependent oxidoreductase [Rhodospirillales bacterium]
MSDGRDGTDSGAIGIIGLGRMGSAMAARLSGQGTRVSGWTRSGIDPRRAGRLGIAAVADIPSLVAGSDIVILSLLDDAAVAAVLDALCRCDLSGRLVVETSTVAPDTLRGRTDAIRGAGGAAIDAPVSGGPDLIASGRAGLYIGGDDGDVARFMPVARLLADRIHHVGGLGAGAAAKIVNNMMLAGFWQTLKESLEVGKRLGLDLATMIEILCDSPAANAALRRRAPVVLGESDAVGFSVTGVIKDIALFVETAEAAGVAAPAIAAALDSFAAHRDAGHGDEDLATMVREAYRSA